MNYDPDMMYSKDPSPSDVVEIEKEQAELQHSAQPLSFGWLSLALAQRLSRSASLPNIPTIISPPQQKDENPPRGSAS